MGIPYIHNETNEMDTRINLAFCTNNYNNEYIFTFLHFVHKNFQFSRTIS